MGSGLFLVQTLFPPLPQYGLTLVRSMKINQSRVVFRGKQKETNVDITTKMYLEIRLRDMCNEKPE